MNSTLQKLKILLESKQFYEAEELIDSLEYFNESKILIDLKQAIQQKDAKLSLEYLNQLIANQGKPETYENIDIVGLQTTYQLLKTQLLVLTNQKTEAEKLIAQFRIRYYRELGFLISEILKERLKLFENIRDKNPDQEFEFQKTQEQYEKFYQQWAHVPKENKSNVDEETRQRLTFAYRKASKICHPDLVDEQIKETAAKIFVQLNKAYIENDVETVEQILHQLENGLLEPEEMIIKEHKKLGTKINQIKNEIMLLKKELESIQSSSTYSFIARLENWDDYFAQTHQKLMNELNELKNYVNIHSTAKH